MRNIPAFCNAFAASKIRLAGAITLAVLASGCAQNSKHFASAGNKFPTSVYGAASPRVVAVGEDVPKGGGNYMVGKPYTVAGHTYYPSERTNYSAVGMASWYGSDFHGRKTANGEVFDMASLTAAHPTMPLPSYARVTNIRNQRSIIVRVNDRGPYHGGRVMDVSSKVAEALDFKSMGTAKVKVEYVGRAGLAGSDDRKLLASLRTDGSPAMLDGIPSQPIMTAERPQFQQQKVAALTPPPEAQLEDEATPVAPAKAQYTQAQAPFVQPETQIINPPRPPQRPFDIGHSVAPTLPVIKPSVVQVTQVKLTAKPAILPSFAPIAEEAPIAAPSKLSALYYTSDAPPIDKFQKSGPFKKFQPRSMEDLLSKTD